jgi:hypothetical protein
MRVIFARTAAAIHRRWRNVAWDRRDDFYSIETTRDG